MPKNYYDRPDFFQRYEAIRASNYCANDMLERPCLQRLLPDLHGKRVLDLGCGTGEYALTLLAAAEHIDAVDVSQNMLDVFARKMTERCVTNVRLIRAAIETFDFPVDAYDVVMSTLALHYVADLEKTFESIHESMRPGGILVFNVEHPVYTAPRENIGWQTDAAKNYLHWKLDGYFETGRRDVPWLGHTITKYHRTVADYFAVVNKKFEITDLLEPAPHPKDRHITQELDSYYRRPTFLIIKAGKRC